MSKPKNPLLQMPEDQQAKLADWLLGGMPYHEANMLVEKEFGVPASASLGRYSSFWQEVCVPQLLVRRNRMAGTAESRAAAAEKNPGRFDQATLDALRQKAYELAESANADPKAVKAIMTLLLKARDQQPEEKRPNPDVDKSQCDAAQAALKHAGELKAIHSDSKLSETEKVNRARQKLFGQLPGQ